MVISPTTGAAVFADNGQYAGNVTLINLTATSQNSLALDFTPGIAGNLVISGSSITGASLWGLYAGGVTGQVWITATQFADNGMTGAEIRSERNYVDCLVPSAIPTVISVDGSSASGNDSGGIRASAQCGNIVIDQFNGTR